MRSRLHVPSASLDQERDEPVPSPSRCQEPTPRPCDWSVVMVMGETAPRFAPAIEPRRRREWIGSPRPEPRSMLTGVRDHVAERVSRFARRSKDVGVVAFLEDSPSPLPRTVQRARHSNLEPLHASRERRRALGFHHEVDVIREHGIVHEPEAEAFAASSKCRLQRAMSLRVPHPRQPGRQLERDVHRMPSGERGTRGVRNGSLK